MSWQQDGQRIALICVRKALQLGGPERAGELTGRRMSWLGALWLSVSAWWWQMPCFRVLLGSTKQAHDQMLAMEGVAPGERGPGERASAGS